MSAPYFGGFADYAGMVAAFSEYDYGTKTTPPIDGMASEAEVIFASYECASYEGCARIFFERDGRLFEVYASHCSCMGLEGQWSPEPVTWEALALRGPHFAFLEDHEPEARDYFRALLAKRSAR